MLLSQLTDAKIGDWCQVLLGGRCMRSMLMKELEERPKLGMMEEIVAL